MKRYYSAMSISVQSLYSATKDIYRLKVIAGKEGMNRNVSWMYYTEDESTIAFLRGGELAVTTGLSLERRVQNESALHGGTPESIAKAFTGRSNIIVMSGAFHGRTLLTMAMTSKKAYAKGQGQLPGGIFRAEFPYLYRRPEGMSEAGAIPYYVKKITDVFEECAEASSIAAVVIEPVQGEGGFIPAPIEYVQAIRKICDENGILLVADEVQCGYGRSGRLFASEY